LLSSAVVSTPSAAQDCAQFEKSKKETPYEVDELEKALDCSAIS
jgi:hypothetical protein